MDNTEETCSCCGMDEYPRTKVKIGAVCHACMWDLLSYLFNPPWGPEVEAKARAFQADRRRKNGL